MIADTIVDDIRRREGRDGLIKLPQGRAGCSPAAECGSCVGPFEGKLAIYAGMNGHQRVAVLLAMLGSERRVLLPKNAVRACAGKVHLLEAELRAFDIVMSLSTGTTRRKQTTDQRRSVPFAEIAYRASWTRRRQKVSPSHEAPAGECSSRGLQSSAAHRSK